MIGTQISFGEILRELNQPEPLFCKGDIVYIRSLDTVQSATVQHSWICSPESDSPYYGYSLDFERLHGVVWDYLVGDTVFVSEREAMRKSESLHFDKLLPKDMSICECVSYAYVRSSDGHTLTATVGKVGDTQLYEHNFYCYHFLRKHPTKEKRDNAYRKALKEIARRCQENGGREVDPVLDELYRVTGELYASRGYAEHNGVKGTQNRKDD